MPQYFYPSEIGYNYCSHKKINVVDTLDNFRVLYGDAQWL